MKIAVISDIHANLFALQAVLDDIFKEKVERILCLGDMIGYFANPKECVELLQYFPKPIHFVRGNHETLLHDECWRADCENEIVMPGIIHADKTLSEEQCEFLQRLPKSQRFDNIGIAMSHDTFTLPGNSSYVLFDGQAEGEEACYSQLQVLPQEFRLCFLGHTHLAYFYEKIPGKLRASFFDNINNCDFPLLPEARYLINPGSVGQPRDFDNRASYAILDLTTENSTVTFRRLPYDVDASIKAIDSMEIEDQSVADKLKNRLWRGW